METSKVFFTDLRTTPGNDLMTKLIRLVKRAGIESIDFNGKFTAIKIHFGEPGNLAFIRPNYAAKIVDLVKSLGGKVFLTDSNTLYSGGRSNAVDHLHAAMDNGFNPISAHACVIIADGLKGTDYKEIPLDGEYCKAPKIGAAIADADIIISMSHFKGHEQTGFGGALKNLGMGSASVGGKLELHSSSQPVINADNCIGCRICERYCRHDAIKVFDKLAHIDYTKCVGCGQCIAVCQHDAAIVPDLGIAASFDPVALDCACADMVKAAPALERNVIADMDKSQDNGENGCSCAHDHNGHHAGEDKFHLVHPDTNWESGVEHGEKIGLGNRKYDLVIVK